MKILNDNRVTNAKCRCQQWARKIWFLFFFVRRTSQIEWLYFVVGRNYRHFEISDLEKSLSSQIRNTFLSTKGRIIKKKKIRISQKMLSCHWAFLPLLINFLLNVEKSAIKRKIPTYGTMYHSIKSLLKRYTSRFTKTLLTKTIRNVW